MLVSALDSARAGAGSVLLIEGPAGIGKPALVEAVRERAAQDGLRVLHGRGSEPREEAPHWSRRDVMAGTYRRLRLAPTVGAACLALSASDLRG